MISNNNNNDNNLLNTLDNISESSLSGIIQDFVERRDKSQPTVVIMDAEGSDFKRLVNKKRNGYYDDTPKSITIPNNKTSLYTRLFEHKDKYFNQDRKELSKDIFPIGMETSSM
ncbi:hypothetical protein K501DRAFT_274648 [Backusella circina FSU 941]|nr:hypothetical protein K501DRAFT_274648 [Backusella circina FSU 941]